MLIIGICGSSGSGKSRAGQLIRIRGYTVADCDAIYRELIQPPSACLDQISATFGKEVLSPDGSLNRSVLRELVFTDPQKLSLLNSITFSFITDKVMAELDQCRLRGDKAFFIDAPLLFESSLHRICDRSVLVRCSLELRLKRLALRDGLSIEQLKSRLSNQKNDEELAEKCTDVWNNEGTVEEFEQTICGFLSELGL